jgi:hypothetical protein
LDDGSGNVEHDSKAQTVIMSSTSRRTRADELTVEILSVERIRKRT